MWELLTPIFTSRSTADLFHSLGALRWLLSEGEQRCPGLLPLWGSSAPWLCQLPQVWSLNKERGGKKRISWKPSWIPHLLFTSTAVHGEAGTGSAGSRWPQGHCWWGLGPMVPVSMGSFSVLCLFPRPLHSPYFWELPPHGSADSHPELLLDSLSYCYYLKPTPCHIFWE